MMAHAQKPRFRLSAKRTSPIKSAGVSVQSTTGSRGVRISSSNVGYTMFWGSVKSIGYPLHLPVSPSLPLPCVTVCHRISTGLYFSRHPVHTNNLTDSHHCHACNSIITNYISYQICSYICQLPLNWFSHSSLLVITVNLRAAENFCTAITLLCYTPQNITLTNVACFAKIYHHTLFQDAKLRMLVLLLSHNFAYLPWCYYWL